jgi:hypothetical protein
MVKRAFQKWIRSKPSWGKPLSLAEWEHQLNEAFRAGVKAGRTQVKS